MPAPIEVKRLVDKFAQHRRDYHAGSYNETQVRRDFIDPMLKALGWDVDNTDGASERYREVVHEDRVRVGGESKAPDYSCRLGGNRVFFVEAKKPSVDLKDDPAPAFQLRRYAWSAKLPVSVLTDFAELVIYDTTAKPAAKDKAAVGRLRYWTFEEYVSRWDEIAGILSKEAVRNGSFDKFAADRKRKAVTQVDDDFLEAIEKWRDLLARDLAKENPKLDGEELSGAVQRILDRIVFLRISEDRGIEPTGQLHALVNGPNIYARLKEVFARADNRYNSGLFHFRQEAGRHETPDTLTLRLRVSDTALKKVLGGLYDDAPWIFSVIPADILGAIYERFLGKVIHRDGRGVRIEEKPEVRKAGGVYYTPKYIVDYIVKETVGKLLEGKSPQEAAEITVLDPACGSGSFLIGAYQYLLDWHLEEYLKDPRKYRKRLTELPKGVWRLTSSERKRILTNSIYGVDIDPQAVEVTKLSLLLKVLEGESALSLQIAFDLTPERALPDLGDNVKCGDSLLTPEFHVQSLFAQGEESVSGSKAFDWSEGFPAVFTRTQPGFDAIVGNPPYIPMELMTSAEKAFFQTRNPELTRKYDSAAVFFLVAATLLRNSGVAGFITSVTWQTGPNYRALRQKLFHHYGVRKVVNLPYKVFGDAFVDTGVVIFQKRRTKELKFHRFPKKQQISALAGLQYQNLEVELIDAPEYRLVLDQNAERILRRSRQAAGFTTLGAITESTQGLAGNLYQLSRAGGGTNMMYLQKGQVYRYRLQADEVIPVSMVGKESLIRFYEARPKILIRRVISRDDRLLCTYSQDQMVLKKDINPFVLVDAAIDPFALLAVMNSRTCSYLYVNSSAIAMKDDFRQTTLAELRALPVPRLERGSADSNRLATMAQELLRLGSRLGNQVEADARWIALDAEIEKVVDALYALTPTERAASLVTSEG